MDRYDTREQPEIYIHDRQIRGNVLDVEPQLYSEERGCETQETTCRESELVEWNRKLIIMCLQGAPAGCPEQGAPSRVPRAGFPPSRVPQ